MGLSLGRLVAAVGSFAVGVFTGNWALFVNVALSAHQSRARKREERRAIAAYNATLQDRLEMRDLEPNAPRTLVMGRTRYVEGVRKWWTSGADSERLTMIVSFAGHRIDGFEQWYLFDMPVTLDAEGYVQQHPYFKANRVTEIASATLNGAGGATITLPQDPEPGAPLFARWRSLGGDSANGALTIDSVAGRVVTVSGGQPGAFGAVYFQWEQPNRYVRIRPYLGTDSQNVGADLAAEYPGKIDASHAFKGIALAVVDCYFNPDVFPQGRPNISAVMRGAHLYDPRKDSTVAGGSGAHRINNPATWEWSENLALQADHYSRWANGWALKPTQAMPPELVAAEAAVCDQPVTFTLRKPDGSTTTQTLPRYSGAITAPADADPDTRRAVMDAIMEAMAGADGWDGGGWRFRAGRLADSAFTLDATWLANKVSAGGQKDTEAVLRGANTYSRERRINRVTGRCVDSAQRYQTLPFPAVEDAVLVGAKGLRAEEVNFEAVQHVAQAQHLASIYIRQAQAGTRIEALCNLKAYRPQLFDVGTLVLPRQGIDAGLGKRVEVIGRKWSPRGRIRLQLAEISAALFTVEAELRGRDPAPDSNIRRPWNVEALTGLEVASGTPALVDASVITRTLITWDAATTDAIRRGGRVEVQYTPATTALPAGDWPSWPEQGNSTAAVIPGLLVGTMYLFRARFVQVSPPVNGPWSLLRAHVVAATRTPRVFRQNTAPTGDVVNGDTWFDSDDGNHPYGRIGGAWVSVRDGSIADALTVASAAAALADGKVALFKQSTPPTGANPDDIWIHEGEGNRQYVWDGATWEPADDARIGTALAAAAGAQATADGKVTTFRQATPPTAEAVGDLWIESDNGNRLHQWDGSAWVPLPIGTGGLQDEAVTAGRWAFSVGGTQLVPPVGPGPGVDVNAVSRNVIGRTGGTIEARGSSQLSYSVASSVAGARLQVTASVVRDFGLPTAQTLRSLLVLDVELPTTTNGFSVPVEITALDDAPPVGDGSYRLALRYSTTGSITGLGVQSSESLINCREFKR